MDLSYYNILGVDKNVDDSTLKRVWKKLSLKYHPDRLSEEEKQLHGNKMREINEAYDILSDPKKRAIYDRYGKEGLDKLPGQESNQHKEYVPPIKVDVELTLEEIYKGKTINPKFNRLCKCESCNGTGVKSKVASDCTTCKGDGNIKQVVRNGPFIQRVKSTCHNCRGTGLKPGTQICMSCKGKRMVRKLHTITEELPRGCIQGDGILVSGEGHEIPVKYQTETDETHGDVHLIIKELPHKTFTKLPHSNQDLLLELELDLAEALCGFVRIITHLDGRKLFLTSDKISNNDVKVIKGEGLPSKSGDIFGDLVVNFKVNIPNNFDKELLYKALTGDNFNDINFTPKDDEQLTVLSDVNDTKLEDDEPNIKSVQCPMQ